MSGPIAVDDRTEWLEADGHGRLRLRDHARRAHPAVSRPVAGGHDAADRAHGAGQRAGCLGRVRRPGRSSSPASAMPRAFSRPSTEPRWSRSWMTRGRRGPIVSPTEAGSSTSCSCPTAAPPWRSAGGWWAGATGRSRSPCVRSSRGAIRTRCTTRTRRSASRRSRRTRRWRGGPTTACRRCTRSPTAAIARSPQWYRGFLYSEERARGLDDTEDLAAPGVFRWDLSEADAVLLLGADGALAGELDAARRLSAATAARSARGGRDSRPAWSARAMPTSSGAIRGRRSSPAIRGSPTGGVTRSSRSEGSVSRPAGWTTRDRSCWSGRASSRKGCCPTASSIRVMPRSTTPWMRRSGTSSPCTSISRPPKPRAVRHPRATARPWAGPCRTFSRGTCAAPATASGSRTTASSPPASPVFSSPGWMRRSATGS